MTAQPNPVDIHIGRLIRARRMACHLSQGMLARKLGVTFQQVQKYEKGSNRVSGSRLQQIAGALGVTPAHFFEGLPEGGGAPGIEAVAGARFMSSRTGVEMAALWPALTANAQIALVQSARIMAGRPLEALR